MVFIFYPAAAFASHYQYGNYHIYSNRDIQEPIKPLLDIVDAKLQKSEIYSPYVFRAALCNSHVGYAILTDVSYSSFGITRAFTNFIVLTKSDVENDKLTSSTKENNIRSINSVLTHEMTHVLINNHYGIKRLAIATWKQEGYCEYIAKNSSYGEVKGLDNFVKNIQDSAPAYNYFKYRLYVTYLMDCKQMTFVQVVDADIDLDDLESEIRKELKSENFLFSGS